MKLIVPLTDRVVKCVLVTHALEATGFFPGVPSVFEDDHFTAEHANVSNSITLIQDTRIAQTNYDKPILEWINGEIPSTNSLTKRRNVEQRYMTENHIINTYPYAYQRSVIVRSYVYNDLQEINNVLQYFEPAFTVRSRYVDEVCFSKSNVTWLMDYTQITDVCFVSRFNKSRKY
jgi:hypothetical protein